MGEPAKPFACSMQDCGMSFTNEDHLHVHTKKHDMVLQLGLEQKAAFVADQTPTPTRFIRNCEEVGLFQDLQNVAANPFDEGFKRAMEAKHGILCLDSAMTLSDDVLHTPQMVFPLLDSGESTLYTNNQRIITMSRSSSDENGTIKEFETRTMSKFTNEVTTINRTVNANDVTAEHKDMENVSYKNNMIKIASNIIRKEDTKEPILIYSDSVIKDTVITNVSKEVINNNKLEVDKVPIMSQKSIDFVVESFTKELDNSNADNTQNETIKNDETKPESTKRKLPSIFKRKEKLLVKKQPKLLPKKVEIKKEPEDDYEVFIKLPNGKQFRMKTVDEVRDPKQTLRETLIRKSCQEITEKADLTKNPVVCERVGEIVPNIVKIPTGNLIPVTLVNADGNPLSSTDLSKFPLTKINNIEEIAKLGPVNKTLVKITVPRDISVNDVLNAKLASMINSGTLTNTEIPVTVEPSIPPQIIVSEPFVVKETGKRKSDETVDLTAKRSTDNPQSSNDSDTSTNVDGKRSKFELASRSAASKRYRERLREAINKMCEENKLLKAANEKLMAEKLILKKIIMDHQLRCPNNADPSHNAIRRYVSRM